jgi:hypothetical protein
VAVDEADALHEMSPAKILEAQFSSPAKARP